MTSCLCAPLLLPTLLLLSACGTSTPPAASSVTSRNVTGNWQIQSAPVSITLPTAGLLLLGNLTSTGYTVTGTFRLANLATPNPCGTPLQQIVSVSGTVDSAGNLSLTSAPFSGSTLTIQLVVPANLTSFGNGSIAITGGTCTFASSSAIGAETATVTGTYTGALNAVSTLPAPIIPSGNVTLALTQASSPNSDGQFTVSGSLTFVGGGCTSSTALSGTISGGQLTLASAPTGVLLFSSVQVNASAITTAASFPGASILYEASPCNPGSLSVAIYQGALTRQ